MQSLESSCQEADFLLNEALNNLRRNPNESSSLLIDQTDYTNAASSAFITNPSQSPPATLVQSPTKYHPPPLHHHHHLQQQQQQQQHQQILQQHLSSHNSPKQHTSSSSSTFSNNILSGSSNLSTINYQTQHIGDKRGASDDYNKLIVPPSTSSPTITSGSSPPKRSKTSSSASSQHPSTSKQKNNHITYSAAVPSTSIAAQSDATGSGQSQSNSKFFDIHDKLRELYGYLYLNDEQNGQRENRVKLKSRSHALEILVVSENLNTVVLNLYPGNKGYSLAFRQDRSNRRTNLAQQSSLVTDSTQTTTQTTTGSLGGSSRSSIKNQLGAVGGSSYSNNNNNNNNSSNNNSNEDVEEDYLLETTIWPYEEKGLLESIDNETLPMSFMDLLESRVPNVFYSGCVIVEVRDYRQSIPISACCDTHYVLLKPTNQSLIADVNLIASEAEFSKEDKVALESHLVLATSGPLCLDPNPEIGRKAINNQHRRQLWNTAGIRRQMKKFSQVAINRKRLTDQFTHNHGLELHDHMTRLRQRQRLYSVAPRKQPGILNAPNLDLPQLSIPTELKFEHRRPDKRPKENRDFLPQLVEEHVLATNRDNGRIYHIKLSIYQRPANLEYLGELYVDRDYKEKERNGKACQFSLGTWQHANRYIKQFTEIFTEEGRKSVTVTRLVPGKEPKVTNYGDPDARIFEQHQQQQQQQQQLQAPIPTTQQPSVVHHQQIQLQQQLLASQPLLAPLNHLIVGTSSASSSSSSTPHTTINLNTTNLNTLPGNKIMPNTSATIIGITNLHPNQQHFQLQTNSQNQSQLQQIYNVCEASGTTMQLHTIPQQQQQQQPTHISLGSVVVLQQQSGNIAGLTMASPHQQLQQQQQQQITLTNNTNNSQRSAMATSVPVLQAHLQAVTPQQKQQLQQQQQQLQQQLQQQQLQQKQTSTIHSTNPEITALENNLMQSANKFQQQQQQVAANNAAQQTITGNNAAIRSLLNSAPAAMTSSPVVAGLTTSNTTTQQQPPQQQQVNCNPTNLPPDTLLNPKATIQQQQHPTTIYHQGNITQNILTGNLRKITIPQQQQQQQLNSNRVISSTNLISVGSQLNPLLNSTHLIQQQQQLQNQGIHNMLTQQQDVSQQQQLQPQQLNVRVTMSALASQLASPPALMSSATIQQSQQTQPQQQHFNFAQTSVLTTNLNNLNSNSMKQQQQQQQVILSNSNQQRLMGQNQQTIVRRDSMTVPSPGSDSNASNASSSNLGSFQMSGLNVLLATSPPTSIVGDVGGPHSNHSTSSTLMERLTGVISNPLSQQSHSSQQSPVHGGPSPSSHQQLQFMSPSPKSNPNTSTVLQQHQHHKVQSPSSISPLSSPPPQQQQQQSQQQTTTLNLQGINLQSLQAAMATFPNLQNVQVQMPGLSLSGAAAAALATGTAQPTGVLVSVPVTNTTQVNQIQAIATAQPNTPSALGSTAQTVMLTNAQPGSSGSMLSLPLAQLVASSVKSLNQRSSGGKQLNNSATGSSIQLLSAIQRPRNVSTITAAAPTQLNQKQLVSRALVTQQQQLLQQQQQDQRNMTGSIIKMSTPITVASSSHITTTTNITSNPLVMTTQQLQKKLQKQGQILPHLSNQSTAIQQQQPYQIQQLQHQQQPHSGLVTGKHIRKGSSGTITDVNK